eukprot:TRINITY_DN7746_c0_g3_i1.p1 TRINITY_DN7746_c0_g3~~TRINITY_DN7746_c0_g3_i1.p1  ORF type:complete len:165 (-),score=40.96 TRINITY_DN7746_c0_g3_i1:123-617(-)
MILDWLSCGREKLGEVWQMDFFSNKISISGPSENNRRKLIFREHVSLSSQDLVPVGHQLREIVLFGMIFFYGKEFVNLFFKIENKITRHQTQVLQEKKKIKRLGSSGDDSSHVNATWSFVGNYGGIMRFSGSNSVDVRHFLFELLSLCSCVVGLHPWEHKMNDQ